MSWADKLGLPQVSVSTAMAIYVLAVFFSFMVWVYHVTHKEKSHFYQGLARMPTGFSRGMNG